jgi:hypothetical protein
MLLAYVKEQLEQQNIDVQHIPTSSNRADLLSKPIYGSDFKYKADLILDSTTAIPN